MTEVRQRKLRWVERGRVNAPKGTMPWPCQARTLCHCLQCLLCQHALCPRPLQRGHTGGCHASASITIRGWSMQRLPTVTAHIAVVIAALYRIPSPMQMMFAGDVLPLGISLSLAVILSLTKLEDLTYAPKKWLILSFKYCVTCQMTKCSFSLNTHSCV